jgi:methyl-accepting chemotaxis protein
LIFIYMEKDIPITIAKAVQESFEKILQKSNHDMENLQEKIESARITTKLIGDNIDETLKQTQQVSNKITGDLKNANETMDELQQQARVITNNTIQSSDKAIREYISAKSDLQEEIHNANQTFTLNKEKLDEQIKSILDTIKSQSYALIIPVISGIIFQSLKG